jgi:hypothetical protein
MAVEVASSVKTVIEVLHDRRQGFAKIGEHLEDASAKAFFIKEAETRHTFAHELKTAAGLSGEDVGGTAAGTVHRVWGDVVGGPRFGPDHGLAAALHARPDRSAQGPASASWR